MLSCRQAARNTLPLDAELRPGVMSFTLLRLYMFMRSRPGKVSSKAGQKYIGSAMLEKCLSAGLSAPGGQWQMGGQDCGKGPSGNHPPINVEFHESAQVVSLQQLILEWRVNQLGIQALVERPQFLMLRFMRFIRRTNQTCKNTTPVAIPTTVRCRCLCLIIHLCSVHLCPTGWQPF